MSKDTIHIYENVKVQSSPGKKSAMNLFIFIIKNMLRTYHLYKKKPRYIIHNPHTVNKKY